MSIGKGTEKYCSGEKSGRDGLTGKPRHTHKPVKMEYVPESGGWYCPVCRTGGGRGRGDSMG